jgi:RNA polymerase sigma factor (sigma-70 family)
MSDERSGPVLRQLGVLFRSGTVAGLTDGELLERFSARRGEQGDVAFEALVTRHGPMVLGTCRQLLGDSNDADDVFQATFLTLAQKAASLRQPERLGPWLHGVAVLKVRKLRQRRERRRRHERRGAIAVDHVDRAESSVGRREESAALHEELARLPEKYRSPIVLCYLQGHTHETAASALGWPLGTVRGRLARAREQLRERLVRRGVTPAGVVLGRWPRHDLVPTRVPPRLVGAAVQAASPTPGRWAALMTGLAGAKAVCPGVMTSPAFRMAALLILAGGAALGGNALGRRPRVAESKPTLVARSSSATPDPQAGDRHQANRIPSERIPGWVSNAIRGLQPEAAIEGATRESETSYVVDISVRGEARSVRVMGRFDGRRRTVDVRRIPNGSLSGRRV